MKFLRFVPVLVILASLASCGGTRKAPPFYLERANDTTVKSAVKFQELRIQKNDLLSIQVYSASTRDVTDAPYNLRTVEGIPSPGFLVDANGNIEYPQLGTIHAEGLNKQELAAEIRKRLTEPVKLLENPSVIIRFLNYKITVLGQVGKEGLINIPGEKVTIIEAIGLAGGITDYGKRDRVKIVRETNGQREIGYVDLTSDSLFLSPYYNLVQNDMIFVEPTKRKQLDKDQAVVAQRISFALTIATVAATIYNVFKN